MKRVLILAVVASFVLTWKPEALGEERTGAFPGCYQLELGRWTRLWIFSNAPIFFFQAANDYDLSPSATLSAAMKEAGKDSPSGLMTCSDFWTSIAASRPTGDGRSLLLLLASLLCRPASFLGVGNRLASGG